MEFANIDFLKFPQLAQYCCAKFDKTLMRHLLIKAHSHFSEAAADASTNDWVIGPSSDTSDIGDFTWGGKFCGTH
jgi:hypothetical protein